MSGCHDAGVTRHPVAPAVTAELPGLRLRSVDVEARPGPSPAGLKEHLRVLSDRLRGPQAVALRRRPVPHAHRVFFRHVGLDPERRRTPIERAVEDRLRHGAFRSRNLVDDALLVALVETGVAVWALDGEAIEGRLALRVAGACDAPVPAGRLVVADAARALLELFGPLAPGAGVTPATRRVRLVTVAVPGVPEVSVEEALHVAREALRSGR